MTHEILIERDDPYLRIAQVVDGQLQDADISPLNDDDAETDSLMGRIYLGQVERVVPHLQAAFIDIGLERAGFLGAREARALVTTATRETPIEDCVQSGDVVLVQITRPPMGEKGAQVTADITLPGRGIVLAPCRSHVAVSRAIADDATRTRLTAAVNDCAVRVEGNDGAAGWVVRTAATNMAAEDIAADMRTLADAWATLIDKAEAAHPPVLLHSDLGQIERALRDLPHEQTTAIIIDQDLFARAEIFCRDHAAPLLPLLEKAEADEMLFDRYDIASQLERALLARIDMPSGGWLMIEKTEAMVTIDVNGGAHDAPPLAINLEAAQIIAAQLRLRRLGGLIAIDFIDMSEEEARTKVASTLEAGFAGDKNAPRFGAMSEFCVLEMTRRHAPLTLEQMMQQA